ncbi:MAG: hypothetical protein AB8B74_06830 [Crocinitomicaceae bacterium]
MNYFRKKTNFRKMSIALACIFFASGFSACKKGENDPFLSLRSRDSRLSGTWELVSIDLNQTGTEIYNGNEWGFEYTVTYSDDVYIWYYKSTYEDSLNSETNVDGDTISSYMNTLSIDKNGNTTANVTADDYTSEQTGVWYWANTAKKKTHLLLDGSTFTLDRLTNKEMVLKVEGAINAKEEENKYIIDYHYYQTFKKVD